MSHVAAFVQPERQIAIFDAIAGAWLDLAGKSERAASLTRQLPWFTQEAQAETLDHAASGLERFWNRCRCAARGRSGRHTQGSGARFHRSSGRHWISL